MRPLPVEVISLPPILETIHFMIAWRCNAACIMCPQHILRQKGTIAKATLSTEDFRSILRLYRDTLRNVTLSGPGEPMMHPEYTGMINVLLTEPPVRGWGAINAITNGSLLHKHPEILELPGMLTVSFDAADAAMFESIRQLDYKLVVRNLATAIARRRPWRQVGINMVVLKRNAGMVFDTIKFAHSLGASYVMLSRGQLLHTTEADGEELSPDDLGVNEQIARARQAFPGYQLLSYFRPEDVTAARAAPHCMVPWGEIVVTHEGRFVPCCRVYDMKPIDLGSWRDGDPWHGAKLSRLRQQIVAHAIDPVEFSVCAECPTR